MASHSGIKTLAGDGRTREVKHWNEWLKRVPAIRRKFCRWASDFDPFYWNEAASVAVLANAAAQAGYLAHTEYVALKRIQRAAGRFGRGGATCGSPMSKTRFRGHLRSSSTSPPQRYGRRRLMQN